MSSSKVSGEKTCNQNQESTAERQCQSLSAQQSSDCKIDGETEDSFTIGVGGDDFIYPVVNRS